MNENAHLFVCCRIPLENISLELSSFLTGEGLQIETFGRGF